MKIIFEDKSYIEFTKNPAGEGVFITIAAKNSNNPQSLLVNSVLVNKEKLKIILETVLK